VPLFSTRAAALALGMSFKELDNILSRHPINGLDPSARGRDRKLRSDTVVRLAVSGTLREAFGCSWEKALELSELACDVQELQLGGSTLTLRIDLPTIRERLNTRLTEVSEYLLAPRRGRPVRPPRSGSSSLASA
jgi:hypothetical protein